MKLLVIVNIAALTLPIHGFNSRDEMHSPIGSQTGFANDNYYANFIECLLSDYILHHN